MRQIYILQKKNNEQLFHEFHIAFVKYFRKEKNWDHTIYDFCRNVYYEDSLQQMSISSATNIFLNPKCYWALAKDDSCVFHKLGRFWYSVLENVEDHHDKEIVNIIRRDWCCSKKLKVFDNYYNNL